MTRAFYSILVGGRQIHTIFFTLGDFGIVREARTMPAAKGGTRPGEDEDEITVSFDSADYRHR
jgi:hypothetical protein